MSDYNEKLCDEKHNGIKEKLQVIDKRLDNHSDDIKKTNTEVQDLKEVLIEVKELNKRMIDNNNNNTTVKTSNKAMWGVIIASFLTSASSVIVALVK